MSDSSSASGGLGRGSRNRPRRNLRYSRKGFGSKDAGSLVLQNQPELRVRADEPLERARCCGILQSCLEAARSHCCDVFEDLARSD